MLPVCTSSSWHWSWTHGGRPKRWVVVRPPGAPTGILLAQADGDRQAQAVGDQFVGRVGFFVRVDDFAENAHVRSSSGRGMQAGTTARSSSASSAATRVSAGNVPGCRCSNIVIAADRPAAGTADQDSPAGSR